MRFTKLMKALRGLNAADRWTAKDVLAEATGGEFYGDGGTIHGTGQLDVETYRGQVVAVWFRCRTLPFEQHRVGQDRAKEMKNVVLHTEVRGVEIGHVEGGDDAVQGE